MAIVTTAASPACWLGRGDAPSALDASAGPGRVSPELSDYDFELWNRTVGVYLHDSLWSARDRYDAGHFLMVPLHAAFELGVSAWEKAFAEQFTRFMASDPQRYDPDSQVLDWLPYYYLASRFAVLANRYGYPHLVPAGLVAFLRDRVHYLWAVRPVVTWAAAHAPFPGEGAQIAWKLAQAQTTPSYYRAIVDAENYLLAIGADLLTVERFADSGSIEDVELSEMLQVARSVFEARGVPQPDGGWLFQPGVWTDHPDYAYAGQPAKVPGMAPAPVPGIAEDASHSFRFPLWLRSFREASGTAQDSAFWDGIRRRLEVQFVEHVLVPPTAEFPGWRTTNFMDGRNGVYRWNYTTQGTNNGYGPYELSGSFMRGWWVFLGGKRLPAAYLDAANRFPLTPEVVTVYVGPNTTRVRNPLVALPNNLTNGFSELLVRLAARLGGTPTR